LAPASWRHKFSTAYQQTRSDRGQPPEAPQLTSPVHQGERGAAVNTIAQGTPVVSAEPVVTLVCVPCGLPLHARPAGAASIRCSLRPPFFRRDTIDAWLGQFVPRGCGVVSCSAVLRAKRSNPSIPVLRHGLLRGACHRARVRATRWLAMTKRRAFAFPRRDSPEFYKAIAPGKDRGSRECRMHGAPAALRANGKSTQASHHRYVETIRHSLRDGVTAYT